MAGSIEWPLGAPGSDEAHEAGCTCPTLSNGHGRGAFGDGAQYGWWQSLTCPVHGGSGIGKGIEASVEVITSGGAFEVGEPIVRTVNHAGMTKGAQPS